MFFEKNNWVKISGLVNEDIAKLLYLHTIHETQRLNYIDTKLGVDNYDEEIWGTFRDPMSPGDFGKYGDPIMDSLMQFVMPKIEECTGLELDPNYTYHRLYTSGTELVKHIDRVSCEVSVTLCLGYDVSNVDGNVYPDYDWPMFIKETDRDLPVHMKPGDALIYRGDLLEHWREPFIGVNHCQVFLHYNNKNTQYTASVFDGRPLLGLPPSHRTVDYYDFMKSQKTQKVKIKIID